MVLGVEPGAIARAAAEVRRGRVVATPTETLYGLAADASSPAALERLLEIKQRPLEQSIPLIVADRSMLEMVVTGVPAAAAELMRRHWPGPLTLILPGRADLPRAVVNEAGGVAVRISSDPVAGALAAAVGRPITATSANRSGAPPATIATAAALFGVALVLDDGLRDDPPSAVVDATLDPPVVLRAGALRLDLP